MKILFTGGGTLGPVTPLLAVARAILALEPTTTLAWIGTPTGPERALIEQELIPFCSLPVVKLVRYPSKSWLTFPWDWYQARKQARVLIDEIRPDVVVTAGGFTSVPVIFAARKRGIPCAMHQLDLKPGLANKQVAPYCQSITTSFEYERPPFRCPLADERITTPTRFRLEDLPSRIKAARTFGLNPAEPIMLVFGGGTGALAINALMEKTQEAWLQFTQVIHLTGKGKRAPTLKEKNGYVIREFLNEELIEAYAAADLVVSRAGFGTLSEMTVALQKPTIVIPLPGTEQELNARAFEEQGSVVVVYQDAPQVAEDLLATAQLLLNDKETRQEMGEAAKRFLPTDDGTVLATRVLALAKRFQSRNTKKK